MDDGTKAGPWNERAGNRVGADSGIPSAYVIVIGYSQAVVGRKMESRMPLAAGTVSAMSENDRMRKCTAFAAAMTAACSSAPVSFHGVAPPGRETAYQCAVAQLNIMGYTIEDGNSDTGFVRGRKQTSGLGTQIFTGNTYHDLLTATAFDDPSTGDTSLRVVASRIAEQDADLFAGLGDEPEQGEDIVAPSDSGKSDAQALLFNCGVSNVTSPPGEQGQRELRGTADRL